RERVIVQLVTAHVVLELPRVRSNVLERDPARGELEWRGYLHECGVLMDVLLRPPSEVEALEGNDGPLEHKGEEAQDRGAEDDLTRGFGAGVHIQELDSLFSEPSRRRSNALGAVFPDLHERAFGKRAVPDAFDVCVEPIDECMRHGMTQ